MFIKLFLATSLIFNFLACSTSQEQAESKHLQASIGSLYTYQSNQSGFDTKTYFYDSGSEIIVFDAQFTRELAEDSLSFIRSKSKNPISFVVVTHPNPDKFNGVTVFQELGAKVIASNKTADALAEVHLYKKNFFVSSGMFTDESYPLLASIDETFEDRRELSMKNGDKVILVEFDKPGVSRNQTVAFLPNQNALIVGDLVHYKAHAWLEGGIIGKKATPTLKSWIDLLPKLKEISGSESTLVYAGRGEVGELRTVVGAQIEYLKTADAIVENYLKNLEEAKSELNDKTKAQSHFANVTAEFEKAYPEYALPYMIQFGVYGLMFQKLEDI